MRRRQNRIVIKHLNELCFTRIVYVKLVNTGRRLNRKQIHYNGSKWLKLERLI